MCRPISINSNNPIQGSGFNPRQEGAQAPDLKQFALTIDDFRQFASGKYNAGANPGERAGVHRTWERLESAKIDPTEAASIRLAFAFALEDAGVSGAKMAAACKRLGLEADFSFSKEEATVYTALSREEVSDIIAQSLGGQPKVDQKKAEEPNFYQGLVFRGATRAPDDPSLAEGFKSQNDLSVPEHRTEAMGLGAKADNGVIGGQMEEHR